MRIYNDRDCFYQWDTNQKIVHSFNVGDEVHFFDAKQPIPLTVIAYQLDDEVVADVPNILFQNSYPITAYWMNCDGDCEYTKEVFTFEVKHRPKPAGYVYTETEVLSYGSLNSRVTKLEQQGGIDPEEIQGAINDALEQAKESGEFDGKDGIAWVDLGTFDDVMAEMDNLLEDGRYRLWTDDPFCYSVEVERVGDCVGQTHWSSEEGIGSIYFRTGWHNGEEWEWLTEWTPHVTQDWLNQYALKNHKHRQSLNADFASWIETFREGQYQINVQAESKSYIVDQYVFNNKPVTTIHVCQRYFEITEPWKVYARHGTTAGNYVLVDWDDWMEA